MYNPKKPVQRLLQVFSNIEVVRTRYLAESSIEGASIPLVCCVLIPLSVRMVRILNSADLRTAARKNLKGLPFYAMNTQRVALSMATNT